MDMTKNDFSKKLIAPCGMNCGVCLGYFGYTSAGKRRKSICIGCTPSGKSCAWIKKSCKKLLKNEIEYCYECNDFPCEQLQKLDNKYRERYNMSMIENLEYIRDNGMDDFLKQQGKKYQCLKCGGVICVHNGICYSCENSNED
jgi:hypothetical protein